MDYKFNYLDQSHTVQLERQDESFQIKIDADRAYTVTDVICQPDVIAFTVNDRSYHAYIVRTKEKTYLAVEGETFLLESERDKATKSKAGAKQKGNSVSAPMPGLVVKVPVAVGDQVTAGTILAIVEAMKTQNELPSPRDGIVKKIYAKEGDQVDALQVLVELE